jgi:hypothetical protein
MISLAEIISGFHVAHFSRSVKNWVAAALLAPTLATLL